VGAFAPLAQSRGGGGGDSAWDGPPPGWDQWASLPVSAPEASAGVLVVRDDNGATLGCPAGGVGASSSLAALPTSGGPAAHPEQERERAGAPQAHFVEAQAEQELWQELRDRGALLNRVLNEALRIHNGPAWRIFQVSGFSSDFAVSSPASFRVRAFPDSSSRLAHCGRIWSAGPGRDATPSTASTPTSTGTGGSTMPSTPLLRP
jgi:hypothetical protein